MTSTNIASSSNRRGARRRGATSLAIFLLASSPACSANRLDREPEPEHTAVAAGALTWVYQEDIFAAEENSGDHFGGRVALSGDTIVAATTPLGSEIQAATYVFTRSGNSWSQQQKLPTQPEAQAGGIGSVAISGDTLVVGAPADDDAGSKSGAAYVFARKDGIWTRQARLLAGTPAAMDNFGRAVAIAESTIVVGALLDDEKGADSGAAYVYSRIGETWSLQQQLVADDAAEGDTLGSSVTISGDTIVVGAPSRADKGSRSGAVYVFTRSGQSWNQQRKLLANDGSEQDSFGNSVAVDGDTLVVGANDDEGVGQNVNSGKAYVFQRTGEIWSQQQELMADHPALADHLGDSVAISGNTIVAGAAADGKRPGSAYVFTQSNGIWSQTQKLIGGDPTIDDRLGYSVAVAGDTMVAGASDDEQIGKGAGVAHVYVLRHEAGYPCVAAGECASGFCVDQVCCFTACDKAGMACSAANNGWGIDGVCGAVAPPPPTSAGGTMAATTSGAGSTDGATGAGGGAAMAPEGSYYSCAAAPGRGAGAIATSLLGATLLLAGRSRRRRAKVKARRGALPR